MSMPLPAERGVPSHFEEWVPRSPELMVGLAAPFWAAECLLILRNEFSTLQLVIGLTLRSEFSALELLIGSWVPLIPRNEFSALQSSPSVELALLPSTRGSPMSMPLPSERPSFSAPQSSVIGARLVGRANIAPLNQRVIYELAAPFWASEFPLTPRNE